MNGVRYACLNHIRNLSTRDRLNRLYALDLDDIEDEEWPDDESIALLHDIKHLRHAINVLRLNFKQK